MPTARQDILDWLRASPLPAFRPNGDEGQSTEASGADGSNSCDNFFTYGQHLSMSASRKQPPRSSKSDVRREPLSLSRPPTLFPPTSDASLDQVDSLASTAAELVVGSSSPSRCTHVTSVSRSYGIRGKSGNKKISEGDDDISSRTRSRSPVKKKSDLSGAKPPIKYKLGPVPQEVEAILKKFKNTLKGKHVMPLCLKDDINSLDPGQFYETDDEFDESDALPTVGDHKTLKRLTKIRDNARCCCHEMKPEPSWGYEVFRPLLEYAVELENLTAKAQVQVEDITTIPVSPQFLPLGIYDVPLQAKRVDFGIYLSQNDDQKELLRRRLEARNTAPEDLCVNQTPTYAEYIRWLPQILAIETKTGESSGVSAEAQLAIWMAGLRRRLETLHRDVRWEGDRMVTEIQLKPIPCVKVLGLEWKMYWCCINEKGETVSDNGASKRVR
ncbi:hypothetical protein FQN50_005960 [Emmonsiellopsis sp. PD_5]|nr:hypothetical protein FQN50_005960 [Emmonsiellopsis sp. PD_5]